MRTRMKNCAKVLLFTKENKNAEVNKSFQLYYYANPINTWLFAFNLKLIVFKIVNIGTKTEQ